MRKRQILAVGSVALDSVRTPFGSAKNALGGSATYFSASARFFLPVSLVAVVGEDFPKRYLERIQKLGIRTEGLRVESGKTFRWEGSYDYDLNTAKTLKTELNVFQSFKPVISESQKKSRYVFLANIDPEIQSSVLGQIKNPRLSACDTMNYWIEHKKRSLEKLLKKVDIFLCNDSEARELSSEFNLIQASRRILSYGPKLVVIKKGEHGVLCFSKDFIFLAPAYLLEKVFDPTGAGDTFAGGFIGYLCKADRLNEGTIRQAVVYGSVLASYNVESFSLDRVATLKFSDIQTRYRQFREMTRF